MRFFSITLSPPGFYRDEAAISAQVICVQQSGESLQQEKWPLFAPVLAGGFVTPTYLYPATAWTTVFGNSISSFREFTAFFSLFFIVGSFVFGRRFWNSREAGLMCALSAAISPWAFQFARIAWDPALAPTYMVWAFALLWGRRNWELALSGVFFSLAAYCYPPLRLQLALMMPFAIFVLVTQRKKWRPYLITIATATVISVPLLIQTLSGDLQARFNLLSIFNHEFLRETYGDDSIQLSFKLLFENLALLLSPSYLFLRGDENLRHSTGQFGLWSWLDIFAFFLAASAGVLALIQRRKLNAPKLAAAFVIVGYVAGLLPAALTWEGNPHALRSFGAITFLSLGVGGVLGKAWCQSRKLQIAIIAISTISFLVFTQVYFVNYPKIARREFDVGIVEGAVALENQGRLKELPTVLENLGVEYEPLAISYYFLSAGIQTCPVRTGREKN